jgi:hypothetical protein
LSLNPNGLKDDKLKIQDLLGITVEDYHCDNLLNQQEDNEATVALAIEEAIDIEEEERKE